MRAWTETGTAIIFVPLLLIFLSGLDISSADILHDLPKNNPLNIDWYPAPSPEDGPPLSKGASRDKSLLPAQISAIVGAYIFSICVVGVGLFFASRKLRRQVVLANRAKDIEMLEQNNKPAKITIPPHSPQSPSRNFSWPNQEKNGPAPYVFPGQATSPRSPKSPYSPKTPPSFGHSEVDTRIVERDQQIMGRDLEDLYAHVMQQEEAKAAGVKVAELPLPSQLQSVGPVPPTAPQRIPSPKKIEKRRPSAIETDDGSKHGKSLSRTSSIISALISPRKSNSTLKGMRISSPISPKSARWQGERGTEEENEPLTPRYYAPPPPPPVPKDQVPYTHTRKPSTETMNATLHSPTRSIAEQLEPYGPGAKSAFHKVNQSQASIASTQQGGDPPSAISQTSTVAAPWQNSNSANNSTRKLPLRQFEPAITSPSYTSFAQSTKTTVLERTAEHNRGPRTAGLNTAGQPLTPWSAGAVPYSPYQPFTPMIPITPRLVTREERKMKERLERKAGLSTPRIKEDLVKDEADLWDSGY